MSAKTTASLRKAVAFRAVELSFRSALRDRTQERFVEQVVLLLKEALAEVTYAVLTSEARSRSNREADGGYPSAPGVEDSVKVVQEVVKLVPRERVQQPCVSVEHVDHDVLSFASLSVECMKQYCKGDCMEGMLLCCHGGFGTPHRLAGHVHMLVMRAPLEFTFFRR